MFINEIIIHAPRGATTLMRNKHTNILYYGYNPILNFVSGEQSSHLERWKKYYDKDLKIYKEHFPKYDSVFGNESRSYLNKNKGVDCLYQYADKPVYDVWKMNYAVNTTYPTQKPFKLLERIICLSTK